MDGLGSSMHMSTVHSGYRGMRPNVHRVPALTSKSFILDIVAVTGLVDFKQQWNAFDQSFSSGVGYYPERDKPEYQYLQVERREVNAQGEPKTGNAGTWADISEVVSYNIPERFPEMHQMPLAMHSTAPDVVAPENYDPITTGPVPPIVMFDYRPFINHPKLADKVRVFPEPIKETIVPEFDPGNLGNPDSPFGGVQGSGRRGAAARLPLVEAGIDGGGMSEEVKATRRGSDFIDYWKSLESDVPTTDYRLVRFFDIQAKKGRTYEYRMRVWINDPNNEDVDHAFAELQRGGSANRRGGMMKNGRMDDRDEMERPRGRNGSSGRNSRNGINMAEKEVDRHEKITLTSSMFAPAVRVRKNNAREAEGMALDPETNRKFVDFTYFVSEARGKDADDKEIVEEVQVPKRRPYLRFARPSAWSDSIRVTVEPRKSDVVAGKVTPPKAIRLKVAGRDREFPAGEPVSEVVASVWSRQLGTSLPGRKIVYRGDALDFYAATHVLHPISWDVLLAENDSDLASGTAKFLVPIETGNVVIDAMGGTELALPRVEKMRHHLPSEILVMDEFGEFHVQNDMEDRDKYQSSLFLADESQTVGKVRTRKPKRSDPDFDELPRGEF